MPRSKSVGAKGGTPTRARRFGGYPTPEASEALAAGDEERSTDDEDDQFEEAQSLTWVEERVPKSSRAGDSIPRGEWPRESFLHRRDILLKGGLAASPARKEASSSSAGNASGSIDNDHRRWRRGAHRRAVRQGSTMRNQYTLYPKASTSCSGDDASASEASLTFPGSLVPRGEPTSSVEHPSAVRLHVYSLFGSFPYGAFHAGVEVFGIEWSYGATHPDDHFAPLSGIYPTIPTTCPIGTFLQTVELGHAKTHDAENAWKLLQFMAIQWLAKDYHVLERNCLHFCSELLAYLHTDPIPGWVTRFPRAAQRMFSRLLSGLDLDFGRSHIAVPGGRRNVSGEVEALEEEEDTKRGDGAGHPIGKRKSGSGLSDTTAIALAFETEFRWARVCMSFFEEAIRRRAAGGDGDEAAGGVEGA